MRIAIPPAPGGGVPIPDTNGRTSVPPRGPGAKASETAFPRESSPQAPEELWGPCGARASCFAWVLAHRALVLGLAFAVLLATAAILPALGIVEPAKAPRLMQPGFAGIGSAAAPGWLSAGQLPPRDLRRVEPSRTLSLIAPSVLPPSAPTTTAQSVLVGMDLPAGVTPAMPGHGPEGQQSFRSLLLAFALAVFLVYLVTASQLESLLNPLSILFTIPMGLIAAAWGLYATGATLNAVALIGTILLAGMLVNNAIILIDAIKNARARGTRIREATIQASRARARPIMITSIGTVLGLLPMAVGVGESIGIRRPITITVIAGLAVATFLVAVAAPVLYTLLDPRADKTI